MIVKNIPCSTLSVEPEQGKIWLNSLSSCILRIQGINFKQKEEKFLMIDIKNNDGYMYPGDITDQELRRFFVMLSAILLTKISEFEKGSPKEKLVLDELTKKIREVVDNVIIR